MSYSLEHHTVIPTNPAGTPIRLHVVQAGPADGPLLILLHGFPEYWYGWKHQLIPLAEAGYRVWAPDQRGYNLSDKPAGAKAYSLDTLAADVVGLIDAAGRTQAIVVGHDWGGVVAWWVAALYPDRVARLVILNAPHPAVMKRYTRQHLNQLLKSWYALFFQLPALPEFIMRQGNWSMLSRTLRSSSRRGTFSDDDLDQYRHAWSQPGPAGKTALTSMLNWYRAALQQPPGRSTYIRISVPTLVIWGVRDHFLNQELAQLSLELCNTGQLVLFERATHWVQHEEAERVTALIADAPTA